ncbi:Brp/Blh family beta-carotene 15,15'-dioxygenase [Halopenitus persicus]|uniref:Brp/Blh family beta-carotene 15,15'-dioxygenase n=1 Tax=Halopenitus persicus TaxID=1048396 RepID=UPI000BBB06F6|nr:Brp/Blh family beta-carotene 15,15'-dioxygenase [Halopenitus persicus]
MDATTSRVSTGNGAAPTAHALAYLAVVPGWIAAGVLTIAFSFGATVPPRYRWIPLAASVLVIGFPHGAVDHLMVARVRTGRAPDRALTRVGIVYAVLGGGYALAWFLVPRVAVVAFLLLTVVHWGTGELYPLIGIVGVDHLGSSTVRLATAAVRGTLPILVPLIAFPDRFLTVVSLLLDPFLGTSPAWLDALAGGRARTALAAVVGASIVVTLAVGARRALALRADATSRDGTPATGTDAGTTRRSVAIVRPRTAVGGWLLDAAETLLLCAFFLTVPPVLAVGTYFCLWHSLRHVGRLLALDERSNADLAAGRVGLPLWRFARDAAPLTAGGLLVVAGLFLAVPRRPGTPVESIAVYLVAVAVLTLPHTVIVAWADRKQGLVGRWSERGIGGRWS